MRLLPRRAALLVAFAFAFIASTVTFARYARDSTSSSEHLRNLRNDTEKLRDTLRSQRNSPSPRSYSGPSAEGQRALRAQEQARSQADSNRRAAERYADSEAGREAAGRARYEKALRMIAEEKAGLAAKARAQEAKYQADADRREKATWENYRATNHNFVPRSRAPHFATAAAALTWYLGHDRESPNPWAAGHAAILLIDGYGVPADPAAAARILDPRTRREPNGEQPRPELAALFAYLRGVHPEVCVPLGFPADPAAARRDLEALASSRTTTSPAGISPVSSANPPIPPIRRKPCNFFPKATPG